MDEEDSLDILFWLDKTAGERLAEVCRLRNCSFSGVNGAFPERIEKVVYRRKL